MWSAACIFAEILRRRPLFAGRDPVHQLSLITSLLGTPMASDLSDVDEKLTHALNSLPRKRGLPLRDAVPRGTEDGLNLMKQMLIFNATQRISAAKALTQPYLVALHGESEVDACAPLPSHEPEKLLNWTTLRALVAAEQQAIDTEADTADGSVDDGGDETTGCLTAAAAGGINATGRDSGTPMPILTTLVADGLQRAEMNTHAETCCTRTLEQSPCPTDGSTPSPAVDAKGSPLFPVLPEKEKRLQRKRQRSSHHRWS